MNFIQRAFLGITRKVGKSLILLSVIFIMGNLIAGAISIQQATGNVEATIKDRLGAEANIAIDYAAYLELSEAEQMSFDWENISVELIKQVGESSYVKHYDYTNHIALTSKHIESYQSKEIVAGDIGNPFTLKGINYAPVLDFEEKQGELVEGRVFTQEEVDNGAAVTIITKELAELNNLHVGDNFVLNNVLYDIDFDTGEESEVISREVVLEIIGLYEPRAVKQGKESEQDVMDTIVHFQNTMYVPNEIPFREQMSHFEFYAESDPALAAKLEAGEDIMDNQSFFFLKNLDDAEAFEAEIAPILPQLYKISTAMEQYDSIAGPIGSMSELSKLVLLIAVIATVLITGLVVLLFIRDRKHELGIYLSLGEKRSRVVGQILIEVIVIAFIGITISLFSGNILANQVSNVLMDMDHDDLGLAEDFSMYGGQVQIDITEEDVIDFYEVGLTGSYVIGFYVIGLLTILISTIIPLIYIVRLNPKKILM